MTDTQDLNQVQSNHEWTTRCSCHKANRDSLTVNTAPICHSSPRVTILHHMPPRTRNTGHCLNGRLLAVTFLTAH